MNDIALRICMGAQRNYAEAVKKYGQEFAEAVVAQELQLYADNLDSFDWLAEMEQFKEFIKTPSKRANIQSEIVNSK